MADRTGMISNPSFRRSASCGRFNAMLSGKQLKSFVIERIRAEDVTQQWIDHNGLERPVLVANVAGLGLKLPDSSTTLSDIAGVIGPNLPIKIIGVGEQSEITASLGDYAYYMANRTPDHKVLNLISLEVSATRLSGRVQSPTLVRDVDWIDKCWPLDRRARGDFPQVQKYCLCGMAGSYTDFHVDFGGTSVWYHVLSGQKRFYLVAPTTANLRAFEQWTCSKTQDTVFFGDVVGRENCFQLDLMAGQTLLIPGAWIHAVHTPLDSLVFGGNFLHSFNIVRQLQVYGIEQRTFVGKAYRFPHFKLVNWFVLCSLLPIAKKLFEKSAEIATKEGDSDDDDDDNEDLISLCNSIKSPCVFRQFPYLVRTCQFWLMVLDDEEHSAFSKAALEAWCDCSQGVIDSWWQILLSLADFMSAGITDEKEKCILRNHVERVRSVKVFDLLDDNVVGDAFINLPASTFDCMGAEDISSSALPSGQGSDSGNRSDVDIADKDSNVETPSLRIKLKLTKNDPDSGDEVSYAERLDSADDNLNVEEESGLRFKFQMPNGATKNDRQSYSLPEDSQIQGTKFNITIGSSSSQANSVKSRMAIQSDRMRASRAGQTTGLLLTTKKTNGIPAVSKAAAKRKVRKIDEYEYESEESSRRGVSVSHEFDTANILPEREGTEGGRYSTRGRRVSAAFLLHAEDVDIRDMRPGGPGSDDDRGTLAKGKTASSDGGADDAPFMFDDDDDEMPYGEEEWIAGKSDAEDRREDDKDDIILGDGDGGEDDDSDMGSDEGSEDSAPTVVRKRAREPPAPVCAPSYLTIDSRPTIRAKRVGKVVTNRQRLIAKFK